MSSSQSGEGEIRKSLIEDGPGGTAWWRCRGSSSIPAQIPCLSSGSWPGTAAAAPFRERRGELLFIDARRLGRMVDRTHRELTEAEIARVAATYHAWRGQAGAVAYADEPGFCKSADLDEVRKHGYVLTPGRYVGAPPQVDDGEPFAEKMAPLSPPNGGSSRPRPPSWTRPLRPTWKR